MVCKHCGAEISETDKVCPMCNAAVETATEKREERVMNGKNSASKLSVKALVSFVVSLVGILWLALPCGIVGAVFAVLGIKEMDTLSKVGKGFVITGLILSIVDIAYGIYSLCVALMLF